MSGTYNTGGRVGGLMLCFGLKGEDRLKDVGVDCGIILEWN
jgi:hypothetical protein